MRTDQIRRFRLLPEDRFVGWTPYVWLAYFPTLFLAPALDHAAARTWVITIIAGIVFLPLYFRGYWARGREMYVIVALIAALGVAVIPINGAAGVFFIYAAAFAGFVRPAWRAALILAVLCAVILVQMLVAHIPFGTWAWEIFFAVLVGGANIHFGGVREANKKLFRAQEEIEHLATVAERERIARDLHDLLGHTLSLITIKASLASRMIDRDPDRAAVEIRDVERISREALGEVRAAVAGYRTAGLAAELANVESMLGAASVTMHAFIDPTTLAPTEEAVLALALREGVTNVVRHARAQNCSITLKVTDGARVLCIEDDGRGKHAADGNGLSGMRERLAILGGTVTTESNNGTRLRVVIPMPSNHALPFVSVTADQVAVSAC